MKRRLLSLLLVLVLSAGMTAPASAHHGFTDHSHIHHKSAVSTCVSLGILNGYPEGDFRPQGSITRAEFCKIMAVTVNGGSAPEAEDLRNPFTDVAHSRWYRPHVAYCYALSLVDGVGGSRFDPQGQVTAMQAAKMLLVAMGYDPVSFAFTGPNWAYNVNSCAEQEDLFASLASMDRNAPLSRDNAARMIANALDADPDLYGRQQEACPDSVTVTLTEKTIRHSVPGKSFTQPIHYDLITVLGDTPAVRAINQSIRQDFNAFCQGTGQHALLGNWLSWLEDEDQPYEEWFFPASVSATVTHNHGGILSILFHATYLYDHSVCYAMTFDLSTGRQLTAVECSGRTEAQLLALYRPGLAAHPYLDDWQYAILAPVDLRIADLDFAIDRNEIVLFSPELQYPDGARMNYEVRTGVTV